MAKIIFCHSIVDVEFISRGVLQYAPTKIILAKPKSHYYLALNLSARWISKFV